MKPAYPAETALTGTLQLDLHSGFQSSYSCCLVYFTVLAQSDAEVHKTAGN